VSASRCADGKDYRLFCGLILDLFNEEEGYDFWVDFGFEEGQIHGDF
jgi:hypothetical protein